MKKLTYGAGDKAGQPPGTLIHVGEQKIEAVAVKMMEYDADGQFREMESVAPSDIAISLESPVVTWITVTGLHEIEVLDAIRETFAIHPLLMEDILDTNQRPKMEQYDNFIYIILKTFRWRPEIKDVEAEQVSIVMGQNFVLTFQEQAYDVFEPVRQRLRDDKGRLRKTGADYLTYRLLDTIVDNYFVILEQLGDQIEAVEEALLTDQGPDTMQTIHGLKRELLFLRKSVWPLREVFGSLQRGESPLLQEATLLYVRDVYEHTIQVMDSVEAFRDVVSSLLDIYLSSVSNRMNEVMKVLTVIATMFIPLTFITGLYGMNFAYMPELQWRFGYPFVWLIILAVSTGMLFYFRRRRWL